MLIHAPQGRETRDDQNMRIILSRKGFDGDNGKVPSPLFDDGSAVSLPIILAGRRSPTPLNVLRAPGTPYEGDLGTLVAALTRGQVPESTRCHADPDLARGTGPCWRGRESGRIYLVPAVLGTG